MRTGRSVVRAAVRRGCVVAVAVAACGKIEPSPVSPAPRNACPEFACSAYEQPAPTPSCSANLCSVKVEFPYVFLVTVPQANFALPNLTFAVPSDKLTGIATRCTPPACFALPSAVGSEGDYLVTPQAASAAGLDFGNPGRFTTIPVSGAYVPMLAPPGSNRTDVSQLREAASLGMPLESTTALTLRRDPGGSDAPPGPRGAGGTYVRAVIPSGAYQRTYSPAAPFDAIFPPISVTANVPSDGYGRVVLGDAVGGYVAAPPFTFKIVRTDGPTDGFWAQLVDVDSGMRVSTLRKVENGSVSLTVVQRVSPERLTNVALLLLPVDRSSPLPSLRFEFIGGVIPDTIRYPKLPEPVRVSGIVRPTAESNAIPAEIVFRSQPYTSLGDTGILTREDPFKYSDVLRHEVRVATTPSDGRYEVVLPPGTYDVTVRPEIGTGYATTHFVQRVGDEENDQRGRDFTNLERRRAIVGRVVVTDGRPLADAEVEIVPSIAQAASRAADVHALPRSTTSVTREDGSFEIRSEKGRVDLTIKPREGTDFPWIVVPNVDVGDDDVSIPDDLLRVPAPVVVASRVVDSVALPVAEAIVRVYALKDGRAYVPIGRALTAADGSFRVALAAPPR
ncbi:MAG: hypothetical protein U0169_26485 [Polyangiaceae bacterium]